MRENNTATQTAYHEESNCNTCYRLEQIIERSLELNKRDEALRVHALHLAQSGVVS